MDETQRPGLVVVVIVTDGEENHSREFKRPQIRQMIEHQQSAYRWQFTFLAANQDAFAEGASLGISRDGIAQYANDEVQGGYNVAAQKISRMRKAASAGETIDNRFTDEERQSLQ
jgi:hypothetical protein